MSSSVSFCSKLLNMPAILLFAVLIFICYKTPMVAIPILVVLVVLFILIVIYNNIDKKEEKNKKLLAMSPEELHERHLTKNFGLVNQHLICPHCQVKGMCRVKKEIRTMVSKSSGKAGGVLKINTKSTAITSNNVTQHHCVNCGTTWDV